MPAGTTPAERQFDGGDGTGPGPTPPQVTTYSVAAHWSLQIAPVLGPQPGHSIAPLVVQPQPEPFGYVHETSTRVAPQVVRELANDEGHEQSEATSLDDEAPEFASSTDESVAPPPASALVELWPATPPPQPSEKHAHATARQDPTTNVSMRLQARVMPPLRRSVDAAFGTAILPPRKPPRPRASNFRVRRWSQSDRPHVTPTHRLPQAMPLIPLRCRTLQTATVLAGSPAPSDHPQIKQLRPGPQSESLWQGSDTHAFVDPPWTARPGVDSHSYPFGQSESTAQARARASRGDAVAAANAENAKTQQACRVLIVRSPMLWSVAAM